jgi:hypothetical protein
MLTAINRLGIIVRSPGFCLAQSRLKRSNLNITPNDKEVASRVTSTDNLGLNVSSPVGRETLPCCSSSVYSFRDGVGKVGGSINVLAGAFLVR